VPCAVIIAAVGDDTSINGDGSRVRFEPDAASSLWGGSLERAFGRAAIAAERAVNSAHAEAAEIVAAAHQQAAEILDQARRDADAIIRVARRAVDDLSREVHALEEHADRRLILRDPRP
jgi:cell division septum initiation protein DivIVA